MLGTTVSHYKILEKIGEGGMAEVYLAEDTKLRRQVSLKFLSKELTQDEDRKQRFFREARAAAAVEHPHIAAIYDIDEVDGRTFIAMEYVRGGSLRESIEGDKLSVRQSLDLAIQIADGLATAHQRGVVHRDLKPENVLVSEQGYPKIIDFGLAKLVEPLFPENDESGSEAVTRMKTREGMILGTLAYMSPEQARGQAVDARSDIFSFGVLLDEMLSGESPFKRDTAIDTLSAILKEPPAPVLVEGASVRTELDRVLRKTMQKDPEERYQTMEELTHDLRALRDTMTSGGRPALVALDGTKSRWAAIVAAIAIAGLVAGWFFLDRDGAPSGLGVSGRPSVAVLYFESMSGDEEIRWLSKGLPTMLVTDLAQTPGLDVVSSQRIHEILRKIGQDNLESIDKSVVAEVARKAGAGAVVVGSIFKSGDEVRIDVQIEDVGTGRVLSAESVRGEDIFVLVDELTGRIRTSLNLGEKPAGRPLAEVTTPSLEAFQLYAEAYQAHFNVRYTDARELYEEALSIDPSFAMVYYQLSNLAGARGDIASSQEYIDRAYEHLDRLPERQKQLVRAQYATMRRDDVNQSVRILTELIEGYPDEEEAWVILIAQLRQIVDEDEALAVSERSVKALPHSGPLYNMYGYVLLDHGRYPEAIRALETYVRLDPDEANPHDSLAEAFLIAGQPERALEQYARTLEVDASFRIAHIGRTYAYGSLGRYDDFFSEVENLFESPDEVGLPPAAFHYLRSLGLSRVGRYREAEEELERGIEVARLADDVGRQGQLELLRALYAVELGLYQDALSAVQRAEALLPRMNSVPRRSATVLAGLLAGLAEVRSGNLDAAQARSTSQLEILDDRDPGLTWEHAVLEGELALSEGQLAAAEEAYLAGEPAIKMPFSFGASPGIIGTLSSNCFPFHDGLARVRKAEGDLDGAIEIYRELLNPDMGSKWTLWLEPRYVLRLARLLDETGDLEGARREYERFLELWKDADEGLAELDEARAYLAE